MKPLTLKEHQKMDELNAKPYSKLTSRERATLDKLTMRWVTAGDVMPDVFKGLFNF